MGYGAPLPLAISLTLTALAACDRPHPLAPPTAPALSAANGRRMVGDKKLGLEQCLPAGADFTLASTNPFFPIAVGSSWLFRGEEDGVPVELLITVLDETEIVAGVTTRVIEEREWEDGELFEVSRNYYAATSDGTVCYFGEAVDFYENGEIVSHEGSWRADAPGNAPGIIMPADPRPGMTFQMEAAPGIAADAGKIIGTGPARVPAGLFLDAIRVRETNPLDGDVGYKIFASGVGLVVDGPLQLVSHVIGLN